MDLKHGVPSKPFWAIFDSLKIPGVLRATANQWRIYYDVPPISSSTAAASHPVLPHPEHSNVHFGQPDSVIPDHTYILQSCWGRSAQYHSQGSPTSLYWPPWRTTPPSSPSRTRLRQTTSTPPASTPALFLLNLRDLTWTTPLICPIQAFSRLPMSGRRKETHALFVPCSLSNFLLDLIFTWYQWVNVIFPQRSTFHSIRIRRHGSQRPSASPIPRYFQCRNPGGHPILLLDLANYLLVLTHLPTDLFWSLWITLRYNPPRVLVN